MSKSLLRYNASTAIYSVAYASQWEAHSGPKTSGFRDDGNVWKTTDPRHVGRLGSIRGHVLEATDAAVIAFEAARLGLSPEFDGVVLVESGSEQVLLDREAESKAAFEKHEAEQAARRMADKVKFLKSRDRQAAGLELPTGAVSEVCLRWDNDEKVLSVRHPFRGPHAHDLTRSGFEYDASRKRWNAQDILAVAMFSVHLRDAGGKLPATVEAAAQAMGLPLEDYMCDRFPVLIIASTEVDEDMRLDPATMLHLAGADAGMIEAAFSAMRHLAAADDDHAKHRNEVGFGKAHGAIGHRLSILDPSRRAPYDQAFALKLARLHRKQLPAEIAAAIGQARS